MRKSSLFFLILLIISPLAQVIPQIQANPGGMEQMIFGGYYDLLHTTNTEYNSLVGGTLWRVGEVDGSKIVSTDGVIKNLRVKLNDSPGVGNKYTFTLMLNGAPTALTFDIAGLDTSGSDMVNEIVVTGGDWVSIRCVPDSIPTARYATWTSVFEGDTPNESLILGGSSNVVDKTATEYVQIMSGWSFWRPLESYVRQVCPTSGTIKNLYVKLSIDPGNAPDAYTFTLRKGPAGGPQADTGLTVTIVANDKTGSDLVNTVDVVAGDILTLKAVPVSTPASAPNVVFGMTFVADTDGESIVMGGSYQDLDSATTEYIFPLCDASSLWIADETQRYQLGQVCTLKKLHVLLSGSPGVGNKYDFTIRIAGADSNVVATVADAAITGDSGALEDDVALDNYVTLKVDPDSSPTVRDAYWGFVCYIKAYMPPSDPALLFGAGFNSSSPYVELHWNHSLIDVQFFEVQNSSDGVSWTYLGNSTTANYTDSQVVNGTERYYRVRANNLTDAVWYNSSFSDVDFETVYFLEGPGTNVTGVWTFYNASAINTTVGTLDAGTLASLHAIDGDTYNVSEVVGAPGILISVNFTGIDPDTESIWFLCNHLYDGNQVHKFDKEVWNFTSSAWVEIGQFGDGTVFVWHNETIYDLRIPVDFLDNGEVRVRFDHEAAGNINHNVYFDYVKVLGFVPSDVTPSVAGDVDIGPWIAIAIILSIVTFLLARSR